MTATPTASMPGEDDPATRVGAAEEADRGITLTWDENDKLDLLFVQGENKFHESTTVTNIENGGKNATFTVPIPEGITDGTPYNLYGVYGGGEVSNTNPELIKLPAIEGTTLNEENVGKKVMLRFAKEGLNLNDAVGAVNFEHVGFLFTAKIKVTAGSIDDITSVQLVGADTANKTWAYNASENHFNIETGTFTANGTSSNAIAFQNSEKNATNDILTVRNWLPATETAWPAIKLSINGTTETATTKPGRTPEASKAYYLYATWDGADLVFATQNEMEPKGTKENPYSVAEAIANYTTHVGYAWVRGYIVGYNNNNYIFSADGAPTNNVLIADAISEEDGNNTLTVELKVASGELNLQDNPEQLLTEVLFHGKFINYYGKKGLKDVNAYEILSTTPLFQADNTPINFTSSLELTRTIAITTNEMQEWTAASSDESWLTVAPANGTGSGDVTITATENTDTEAGRTATITLTPTDNAELAPIVIDVTQKAFEASIIVDPASLTFAKEGGSETIAVTANVDWTATVTGGDGWLTITPTAGKVTATAAENTLDNERTATITITGGGIDKTVAVTQAAEGSGNLLFPGSDFNNWAEFTSALSTHGVNFGIESATGGKGGSGAILLEGTTGSKNAYLFTALVPEGFSAAGKTKINFWIKGTTSSRSLSMNVHTGSTIQIYNMGDVNSSPIVLESSSQNDYSGNVNTNGEWVQVTLNISSIANDISSTPGQSLFAVKIGKEGDYNLLIDDITIE